MTYLDVNTKEKLPNGDVSQFMTAMNKELANVKAKGTTDGLNINDKAHFVAVAKNLISALEYYTKKWGSEITSVEGFTADFTDLGLVVSSVKGAVMSEISAEVFDELTLDEIKKVAKVTEKALKDNGKADLIAKYKKAVGNKSPSLSIKAI